MGAAGGRRGHLAALAIALFGIALIPRLWVALNSEPVWDETTYVPAAATLYRAMTSGDWSKALNLTNQMFHPWLAILIMAVPIALRNFFHIGLDPMVVGRFPGLILGALMAPMALLLGRRSMGGLASLLSAFTLALSPWFIFWGAVAYNDVYLTFFLLLAMLLAPLAARERRYRLPLVGALALAISSKFTAVLFFPAVLLPIPLWNPSVVRTALGGLRRLIRGKKPFLDTRARWIRGGLVSFVLFTTIVVLANPFLWFEPGRLPVLVQSESERVIWGHQGLYAGVAGYRTAAWVPSFILFAKTSLAIFVPGLLGAITALALVLRRRTDLRLTTAAIWLAAGLGALGFLGIMNDTHYVLPVYPGLAFAGTTFLQWVVERLRRSRLPGGRDWGGFLAIACGLLVVVPNVYGAVTVPHGEGFVSEVLPDGDWATTMPYFGYLEAADYLQIVHPEAKLVAVLPDTVSIFNWAVRYRGYHMTAGPYESGSTSYDFVVLCAWSVQVHSIANDRFGLEDIKGYGTIHEVREGRTTFSYILARV